MYLLSRVLTTATEWTDRCKLYTYSTLCWLLTVHGVHVLYTECCTQVCSLVIQIVHIVQSVCTCVLVCIPACVYVYLYACVYMCLFVCVCVCLLVCVYPVCTMYACCGNLMMMFMALWCQETLMTGPCIWDIHAHIVHLVQCACNTIVHCTYCMACSCVMHSTTHTHTTRTRVHAHAHTQHTHTTYTPHAHTHTHTHTYVMLQCT